MPTPPRDQFLDLPEGDPLSTEHLDEKVQQAEQQEQSLKRQLETIEKQKREFAELSRRQELLITGRNDLADKLTELEGRVTNHDKGIQTLFEAIRHLMAPSDARPKQIGFHVRERRASYVARNSREVITSRC